MHTEHPEEMMKSHVEHAWTDWYSERDVVAGAKLPMARRAPGGYTQG